MVEPHIKELYLTNNKYHIFFLKVNVFIFFSINFFIFYNTIWKWIAIKIESDSLKTTKEWLKANIDRLVEKYKMCKNE